MPLYEFRCEKCDKIYEINLSYLESDKAQYCEQCGILLNKIISRNNFHLKGSGWSKGSL